MLLIAVKNAFTSFSNAFLHFTKNVDRLVKYFLGVSPDFYLQGFMIFAYRGGSRDRSVGIQLIS